MNTAVNNVLFSKETVDLIASQIDEFGILETGGVLVGYFNDDSLVIAKASQPGPKAIHQVGYFKADPDFVSMFIDQEYANSDGKVFYIGEWHTHPEEEPNPSNLDLKSLTEISESNGGFCLMLIVGAVRFSLDKFISNCLVLVAEQDNIYMPDIFVLG